MFTDDFPAVTFRFETIAIVCPCKCGYRRPGVRITARCEPPLQDVFVIVADNSITAIEELVLQLDQFRARV